MNINRLLTLSCVMRAMDSAGQSLGNLDVQGDDRGAISLMKIATHLNKAVIETARMMILAAPEGAEVEGLAAAISEASDDAERLEIEAITVEAALEDRKS